MVSKQTGFRFALLALIVVAMLGLPIVSAAQAGNGLTSPAARRCRPDTRFLREDRASGCDDRSYLAAT